MSGDTSNIQKVYTAKEVAVLLGIQNSTVRKYCNLLEESGYHIHKNEHGHRGFFDKDVLVLRQIIDLIKHPDMTLKNAINVVISMVDMSDMSDRDTTKIAETPYITKAEFDEIQHKQMQFHRSMYERQEAVIKELIKEVKETKIELNKQQEYIENKLERRDQLLLENIRIMQAEKEIAATQQKKWWNFWKR